MRTIRLLIAGILILLSSDFVAMAQDAEYVALQAAVKQVSDAVVQIETIGASAAGGELSLGAPISGTVVDPEGYIITSLWGLNETPASILVVGADGTRLPATIVARDTNRELVLLKVEARQALTSIKLTRTRLVVVGQWAVAIGRGISVENSAVSVGIVSATERMFGRAVQIDARVSPSFYGGPVVDIHGELIGFSVPMKPDANSAGEKAEWYDSGIAFVVPGEDVAARIDKLKAGKNIQAGKLGIVSSSKMPFSKDTSLSAVLALSPAKKAGIQAGDKIKAIDGEAIQWNADIKQALGSRDAGEVVNVAVEREGNELNFDVELAGEIPTFRPRVLGVFASLREEKIVVDYVFADSAAEKANVQVGDFIDLADGKPVQDLGKFRSLVMTHPSDEPLELSLLRGKQTVLASCDLELTPRSVAAELMSFENTVDTEDWEIVEQTLPDVPNLSYLLRPIDAKGQLGLIVLLARPGSDDSKTKLETWKGLASEHNLAALVISSSDDRRWKPVESEVVVRMVQQAQKRLAISAQRIAIGGFGAGSGMGMMVALRNRQIFRGSLAQAGTRPGGFSLVENDPANPLQFLVVGGKEVPIWGRVIANAGFPVLLEASSAKAPLDDAAVREAVARWIRSLDRI